MPLLPSNYIVLALFLSFSPVSSLTTTLPGDSHSNAQGLDPTVPLQLCTIRISPTLLLKQDVYDQLQQLMTQRARARWDGDYAEADRLRAEMDDIFSPQVDDKHNFQLVLTDLPRRQGGGTTWSIDWVIQTEPASGPTVLQLAHSALGMAVSYSERKQMTPTTQLRELVSHAKQRLQSWKTIHEQIQQLSDNNNNIVTSKDDQTYLGYLSALKLNSNHLLSHWSAVELELQGRKAADAAFWFALSGTTDAELFDLLTLVCTKEIKRFGDRPSCRPKDILGVVERLAAAGVRENAEFVQAVQSCLKEKDFLSNNNLLDLHSDHCALMVWNFSTRQRKQKAFLRTAAKHWESSISVANSVECAEVEEASNNGQDKYDWYKLYQDPTRPLVVDLGCGMGLCLLGLATNWTDFNYNGVDLSSVAIQYARGIAKRWNLCERLAFVVDEADRLLTHLQTYPGPMKHILLQFPTPYRLSTKNYIDTDVTDATQGQQSSKSQGGNAQLPVSALDGFMVSPDLLKQCNQLLARNTQNLHDIGTLILQSNCEDVAVYMHNVSCIEAGLQQVPATTPVDNEAVHGEPTQRTRNWIAMGGARAIGTVWSAVPLLPEKGKTETEIACILNKAPVHRCTLVPKITK